MELVYAESTNQGPVRGNNEDFLGFFMPEEAEDRNARGAIMVLADGVGGQGHGEVASRMAVEMVLDGFRKSTPVVSVSGLLWKLITDANVAVYDAGMEHVSAEGRMATTLTVTLVRNDQVAIGHVGDCRAYHIHGNTITQLTTDHTQYAFAQRMGLLTGGDGLDNPLRGALTRCIGKEPTVQIDYYYATVSPGDIIVQCTDGVHGVVRDAEILELLLHQPPDEGAKNLAALAAARGTEDNFTLQVVRIGKVEQLNYYRGAPVYTEPKETMGHEVEIGEVLDARFEIKEVIARAGMATIFKALDRETGDMVALKVPFMQYESDPAFYSRFEREEEIGGMLNHPSIMRIIKVDKEKRTRPYIAMELMRGVTLDRVMAKQRPMAIWEAVRIARKLCGALEHMHSQNVIHRDLKPQNIMLCEDGSLRIFDFGIAKAAGMRRVTFAGFSPAMGTPDYMAPEQVKGNRGDERTDVYALGAILFEMVTGHVPFDAPNPFLVMHARVVGDPRAPRKLNPEITPQLEEIILHAMAREPKERYASVAAMEAELANPEQVTVTGRAERLMSPQLWRARWGQVRRTILLALTPIVIFGVIWLLAKCHG